MRSSVTQRRSEREKFPESLTRILPAWLVGGLERIDFSNLEEIRLRAERVPMIKSAGQMRALADVALKKSELEEIFMGACGGSLYAHSETINNGYITLGGGIRIGIAGEARCEDGRIIGVHDVSSLCIRLPHAHALDVRAVCRLAEAGGVLIYSRAGVGKTTVLRAVALNLSDLYSGEGKSVAIVDTRGELAARIDGKGKCIDVLASYPKGIGIDIATRVMCPDIIVCDEIGPCEIRELLFAANCGISIIASAHAASLYELLHRGGMRALHEAGVFEHYVGISRSPNGVDYDIIARMDADAVFENNGKPYSCDRGALFVGRDGKV